MQTDRIKVKSDGTGFEDALEETSRFAVYVGLNEKQNRRLRLLAEETLGMVRAITGEFDAEFWLEARRGHHYRIYLNATTEMDYAKKRELIETSSQKKNAASKGFMGKVRDLFENGLYSVDESAAIQNAYGGQVMYASMGMTDINASSNMNAIVYQWSLERYRESIDETREANQEAAEEAWDELEKSIVANIADDVRVAVSGNSVELVIEKRMV